MKKKVLSVLLCVSMAAAMLAGCGSKETAAEAPAETEAPAEAPAEEAEETEKETLVMGTNAEFPPYEYHEGQEIVGIDAEMAAAVAEKLGMELKIEDMAFDSLIPALSSGKVDIVAAGMTVTEDRLKNVNFSDSYATATQVIIVKADSDIAGVDDLTGKKIGVQLGTTGDIFASDIEGASIEQYNKGMEAVQSLSQGKIDAVIIDSEPAKVFVEEVEGLQILEEAFVTEEYAIAIAKDNEELLGKVNTALEELEADGTLKTIIDKYITAE
ncbi:MAG: basic amino acid ABC transporter substrate-binding protein [Clostridiales bacterium]|nr:basic amino acid ABC transporter substrate-binding protein [Clostridiales bacterium]